MRKKIIEMKFLQTIAYLFIVVSTSAQLSSTKGGDIEFAGKPIANMEKYDGSAATKPKLRLINLKNDTLFTASFNKDFTYDWMRFNFKTKGKILEIDTEEILKGLNYQKNLGSFILKNNLIDTFGNINDTAFANFAEKYAENLTEKYHALNEGNRLLVSTKFDFTCEDNKIFINGKHVGFAILPDNQQVEFKNVQFLDINNKLIASGDLGFFSGSALKTFDKKIVPVRVPGRTTSCQDKKSVAISLLTEMFRNGYYRN